MQAMLGCVLACLGVSYQHDKAARCKWAAVTVWTCWGHVGGGGVHAVWCNRGVIIWQDSASQYERALQYHASDDVSCCSLSPRMCCCVLPCSAVLCALQLVARFCWSDAAWWSSCRFGSSCLGVQFGSWNDGLSTVFVCRQTAVCVLTEAVCME